MCRLSKMENAIHMLEYSRDGNQLAVLVKGEHTGRLLDWDALRNRLKQLDLDWNDDSFLP